jgi:anti-sigma factor RsiW
MNNDRISDERLSAWLDGELDASAAAEVQAWLQHHPDEAARVRRWAADRDALRATLPRFSTSRCPARLSAVAWQPVAWPRWAQAAAVAGLLATGAVGRGRGRVALAAARVVATPLAAGPLPARPDPSAQGWVQRAALAHSVYVPEPRHAVEVRAQEEHLARWLTGRIQMPVQAVQPAARRVLNWWAADSCPTAAGKSAQLMYQDAQGRRVTVYLRRPEQAVETEFRYERQGELGLFYWIEEGCGYALVGALPRETLLALSEAIYQQHPKSAEPAAAPPAGKG